MLLTYTLAYCSFLTLSMAMNKHFQQIFPHKKLLSIHANFLRFFGWALLVAALMYSSTLYGAATAPVILLGLLSAAAISLALLLNYRPKLAPLIALVFSAVTLWFNTMQ
uniref:DUF3325 domain-containing protein n=1 Tax=Cellvibrio fontiphilus TaxID=1815559 RepID=UPI002B4BAEED|nr:DUF3325 domain-containing protein [Cellvibrio fontiphilus]